MTPGRLIRPLAICDPTNGRGSSGLEASPSDDLFTVKLRYKLPESDTSQPLEVVEGNAGESFAQASGDFQFAAAVAGFGMLLRDSQFKGTLTFDAVREIARQNRGTDNAGYRAEFVELVDQAKSLQR